MRVGSKRCSPWRREEMSEPLGRPCCIAMTPFNTPGVIVGMQDGADHAFKFQPFHDYGTNTNAGYLQGLSRYGNVARSPRRA